MDFHGLGKQDLWQIMILLKLFGESFEIWKILWQGGLEEVNTEKQNREGR